MNEILIICRNDISMRAINFHYYAEDIKTNIEGCIHSNKFYLKINAVVMEGINLTSIYVYKHSEYVTAFYFLTLKKVLGSPRLMQKLICKVVFLYINSY